SEESFAAFLGEDPNGTWILTISDDADGDGGTLDSVYLHITTTEDILPVELTSFSYQIVDNGVNLNWITSSQLNNQGFEVQRNTENGNWEALGFVEGQGTTTETSLYSFNDKDLTNNTTYSYRLKQIDFDGTFKYSNIIEVNFETVTSYNLSQNFPNPFNPRTKIIFTIPEAGIVKLTIHNIIGEIVSTLVNKKMEEGNHSILFDASSLPSGTYIYQIEVNDFISTKKMMLVK
ncbi:MAG: T9SS type A sorting domain-containing protein, partial [Ignavibacteria bacterium]|nr:T9SS type A sorting domain-containing protein [Ignavibacteria bacterium]